MDKLEQINIKYWELANGNDVGHQSNLDYSAKCPICGDSKKKKNLKRCHLFTKRQWDHDVINCFNCGWSGNMYSFLETVNPHLYTAYKNERRATSLDNLSIFNNVDEKEPDIPVIDVSFFDNLRESPPNLFNILPQFEVIEENDDFWIYLKNRMMTDEQIKFFRKCTSYIEYNGNKINLSGYIILPLWYDSERIYGFQARSTTEKRFYTFVPEENHGWKVWNWFTINMNKPIYVFESYFDALSSGLDNVVAQLGATLSVDRIKEGEDFVFVLDNQFIDPTAKKESIKYIKQGHKAMIWPRGIGYKDFNDILKDGGSPEKISRFIERNIDEGITAEVKLSV